MKQISKADFIKELKIKSSFLSDKELDECYENSLPFLISESEMKEEQQQLKGATKLFVANNAEVLSDDEAASLDLLFPDWEVGANYKQGDIVRYKDQLFRIGKGTIN